MSDGPLGSNLQDLVSKQQQGVIYLGRLVKVFENLFPRVSGTFTLAAAATTTVANTDVQAGANIQLQATNASAATLQGSNKALYISAINPGVSFTVATASGASAAGTETLSYVAFNPA